jgi:hypothetical protein
MQQPETNFSNFLATFKFVPDADSTRSTAPKRKRESKETPRIPTKRLKRAVSELPPLQDRLEKDLDGISMFSPHLEHIFDAPFSHHLWVQVRVPLRIGIQTDKGIVPDIPALWWDSIMVGRFPALIASPALTCEEKAIHKMPFGDVSTNQVGRSKICSSHTLF